MVMSTIKGTQCSIGTQEISCSKLSFRELSFGADVPLLREEPYSISVDRSEFVEKFRSIYDAWIEDQKADDIQTGRPAPSYLQSLGYPSLETLMEHPVEFEDLIKCYLAQDILAAFLDPKVKPGDGVEWIANSITEVQVTERGIVLSGLAFPRQD